MDKNIRTVRTTESFPPVTGGQWWTTREWRWERSSSGTWYLCPRPLPNPEYGLPGAPKEFPFGLLGAGVEWMPAERAVMHREVAALVQATTGKRSVEKALRDAVLPLVRRTGPLLRPNHEFEPEGKSGISRRGEPYQTWRDTVIDVAALVDLYDVWQQRDRTGLSRRLIWRPNDREPDTLFWRSGIGIDHRPDTVVARVPGGPWPLGRDGYEKEWREAERFRALRDEWQSDPFAVAYRVLVATLNPRLVRGTRLIANINPPVTTTGREAILEPSSPRDRSYSELFRELIGDARFKQCRHCHRWMDLKERRSDVEYHPACRKAAQRARHPNAELRFCRLDECDVDITGHVGQRRYCRPDHRKLDAKRRASPGRMEVGAENA